MRDAKRFLARSLCVAAVALVAVRVEAQAPTAGQPIPKHEAQAWVRWTIPQPREFVLDRKMIVPANQIAVTISSKAGLLEKCAAEELAESIRKQSGIRVPIAKGSQPKAALEIVLATCGKDGTMAGRAVPGVQRLSTLPNSEQAYRIVPLDGRTLALVGTRPEGVFYAAKTLKQLVSAPLCHAAGQAMLSIPMADVTDWPDLAERGLWGGGGDGDADEDIEWLAERKMNVFEAHATLSLDKDNRGVATFPERQLKRAERNALLMVPIIHHLEQLPPEIFVRCPETRAVGDPKAWRRVGNIYPACFSQPKTVELIADWLKCLAKYPTVKAVNIWLAENDVPCECAKCKAVDSLLLQTRVAVSAWEAAKRVRPDLRLRILLTQATYRCNAEILAAVPPAVEVIYYDGSRTYNASRRPMIYPLLENYAAQGRWLGCYPQLMASWRLVCPWSGPQFVKAMMTEFVNKRLRCLCAYTAPSNRFYEFNVMAAAEWSWNAGGRSEREFSLAWATRQGLSNPEKAADWAVTLGPVGWDVYGALVPHGWLHGGAGAPIRPGKRPVLGSGVFTYFRTPRHFDDDLAACQRAMQLAQEVKSPALIEETRAIRGMVEMLKGVYLIADAGAAGKRINAEQQKQAATGLALAAQGSRDAHDGMAAWGAAMAAQCGSKTLNRHRNFRDAVDCVERAMTDISDAAAVLGVVDPDRVYRVGSIGGWTTDDFATGPAQRKTWNITKALREPGRYQVEFRHDSGGQAAHIKRVALVGGPAGDPSQQTELSCDAHEGVTGREAKNAAYTISLDQRDPQWRYFLVVDLDGIARNAPAERSRCVGHAEIRKLRSTK